MNIDIKNINKEIWRIKYSDSASIYMTGMSNRITWCKNQFGEQDQSPKRWKHVKDSATTYRFWFYNEEDYVAFNLAWLNE